MAQARYRLARADRSQVAFLTDLIPETNETLIQTVLADLRANRRLLQHLETQMRSIAVSEGGPIAGWVTPAQGELLYALVRLARPSTLVETGVAHGVSSTFLLQALEDNGNGTLYSIDLPPKGRMADDFEYQMAGHASGWIVPDSLRHRWRLILGDSRTELPRLLDRLGVIDLFFHDSEHSLENMRFEYSHAWAHLTEGGLLLSDDINLAFVQFCDSIDHPLLRFDRMGGTRK